jgi:hypothetical protein
MAWTVFVTGMQRSGTTLLDKLLARHPQVSFLSQAFPFLFLEAKRRFLQRLGEESSTYPLGPLFLESRYASEDLTRFLVGERFDSADLRKIFQEMQTFSGQYTRFSPEKIEEVLTGLQPGDLHFVLAQLYRTLGPRRRAELFGGKEILCEEFLPYLLTAGSRAAIILRDPRDVLASLNHGDGQRYGGRLKPTLFNVRNWRKSVAFAIHLRQRPGFASVRYEDLVADPLSGLDRIAQSWGLAPFPEDQLADGLRDQNGKPWRGNSSHGNRPGVSTASVGIYKKVLPPRVVPFLEAACYPELVHLGYPVSLRWEEVPEVLRSFEDPYPVERKDLPGSSEPMVAASQELRRVELLAKPVAEAVNPFFLFQDVHETLRQAVFAAPAGNEKRETSGPPSQAQGL